MCVKRVAGRCEAVRQAGESRLEDRFLKLSVRRCVAGVNRIQEALCKLRWYHDNIVLWEMFFYGMEAQRMDLRAPVIETQRLWLRPVALGDAVDMHEYASDEETARHLTFSPHESLAITQQTLANFFLTKLDDQDFESHAVVLKSENKMIGTCDLFNYGPDHCAEMGYTINKKYWNQGLVTEAGSALIDWGLNDLKLNKIIIAHHPENLASKRVIAKLGFRFVDYKVQTIKGNSVVIPTYELTQKEYYYYERVR